MYLLLPHQLLEATIVELDNPRVQEVDHHINKKDFTNEWTMNVSEMQPIFETADFPLQKRKMMFAYFAASEIEVDETTNKIEKATGRWIQLMQYVYLPKADNEGFTLPIDIPPAVNT